MVIRRASLVLLIILGSSLVFSQNTKVGNWIMYFGTNKINEKLSIHTELQFRNHTIIPNNTEQLLLRAGLNYHFNKNASATIGYAYIPSYIFGSPQRNPETEESRIWQQLLLNNYLGRIKFEHRYRIEQRFVKNNFRARFRYRLMAFIPLNKKSMEKGSLFIGLYDEIFINSKHTFFDRNRLYTAIGYNFTHNISAQIGYLSQLANSYEKGYLQFSMVINTDFRKVN